MMTFDDLERFLTDWYEAEASAFALPAERVTALSHPDLREFYARFGALAENGSPFVRKSGDVGPLSAQDHVYAASEVKNEDGFEVFLMENQSNHVVASGPSEESWMRGDVGGDRYDVFTATGVPLIETLIACTLMETVIFGHELHSCARRESAELEARLPQAAKVVKLRTVFQNEPWFYFLSDDVIAFSFDAAPTFFAERGAWRR